MAQNFIACDRDQELLLPPSVRDWLPDDHFAWFVLAAVEELDLTAFYGAYRVDGHGRPAHDPGMMVALLLYAYARGQRSSRGVERGCIEDIAYRVIAANRVPDHTTIARFRQRHQDALAGLFGEVLGLCARAGLVQSEVLAVDGTKIHASASEHASRDYEQLAREILEEAEEVDRLEEELFTEVRANIAYEAYRARGVMRNGRRFGGPPKPYTPPLVPAGKVNLTDPDSRNLKTPRGYLQGYNAQAVVTADQIVVAAEVNNSSADFGQLEPMITSALDELERAGVREGPKVALADAGYWHHQQIDTIVEQGIQVLIPPDGGKRQGARPGWEGGRYAFMRRVLASEQGGALYARRKAMIEPVFADTKFNRRIDRFQRRGRAACRSEWRLITATHNLLKLHRHHSALSPA